MQTKSDNKSQYKRRSPEQWQDIMSVFEASGLTQEIFCARESLAASTFHSWRQRLKGLKPTKREEPLFVELASSLQKPESTVWDIELALGDHVVLRLRQSS